MEAEKKPAAIQAIDLDIGELAGIEVDSIEFLWSAAMEGTLLEKAERRINRIEGKALCVACQQEYTLHQVFEPCPLCGGHFKNIIAGEDLRIRALTLVDS